MFKAHADMSHDAAADRAGCDYILQFSGLHRTQQRPSRSTAMTCSDADGSGSLHKIVATASHSWLASCCVLAVVKVVHQLSPCSSSS